MASVTNRATGSSVCRYCSTLCTRDIFSVYLNNGREEIYSEMLSETFNIIVYSVYKEEFSNFICSKCIHKLRDAVEFKKRVLECELALEQYLQQLAEPPSNTKHDIKSEEDDAADVWIDIKKEEERTTAYKENTSDFDDEQSEDSTIPKKESVVEESTYMTRKRKASLNNKTTGPVSRYKKAKTEADDNENESIADTDGKVVVHNQPADITTQKEETDSEESPTARKIILKRSKRKNKPKPKKRIVKISAAPDMTLTNAKAIVQYSTVYPVKVGRCNTIGCVYCKKMFQSVQTFRAHVEIGHTYLDKTIGVSNSPHSRLTRVDVSSLSCRICPQTFQTLEETAKHLKEKHSLTINLDESLGLVPINLDSDNFACVVCGSEFNGLYLLSCHTGSHFALNVCPVCGKKTQSKIGHCLHSSVDRYVCIMCKRAFESLEARKLHYKTSKSCLPYKCHDCDERFAHMLFRQRHYVEAHGKPEEIFPCTKCEQTFPYRTRLTKHYNSTHTDLYKCHYCHERFWDNSSLQNHVGRVHTLEKTYKCQFCECSYFTKSLLNAHMRKHDDNKKFHCKVCKQMFLRRYYLKDHILKSHPGVSVEDI